jgi:hypothetical protein
VFVRPGREGQVHLDRLGTQGPGVVAVGVEAGEFGDGLSARGLDGLVLGFLLEPRPVVGVDDEARQVPQAQPQDVVITDGSLDSRFNAVVSAGLSPWLSGRPSRMGSIAVSATSAASDRPSDTPRCVASEP